LVGLRGGGVGFAAFGHDFVVQVGCEGRVTADAGDVGAARGGVDLG
jgi:hypothetical protein